MRRRFKVFRFKKLYMSIEKCVGWESIRFVLILMSLTYENIDNNTEVTYSYITIPS